MSQMFRSEAFSQRWFVQKRMRVKDCPYEHHSILHDAENVPTVKGDSHHTSLSARADQMKVALGVIWTEAYATDGTVIPVSMKAAILRCSGKISSVV